LYAHTIPVTSLSHSSRFHHLQDVSSETEETGEAGSRADDGAVGTSGERRLAGKRSIRSAWGDRDDGSGLGGGVVGVGWCWGGDAGLALNNWGHGDWLGDGAVAGGDGEGGGLSDGVGLVVEGQGGGLRAVGGVVGDDLGDIGDVAESSDGGHEGSGDGGGGELHLEDLDYFT